MDRCESWAIKKAEHQRTDVFELWCWRRLLRVPWTARRSNQISFPFWRRSALGFLWREWYWSWNSSTLVTWWEELTYWKRVWCWEGLGAGGEGYDRGWDGWMASLTQWTWVRVNSGSWWWTERLGVLRFLGSQRAGHDWATELNWTRSSLSLMDLHIHFLPLSGKFSAIISLDNCSTPFSLSSPSGYPSVCWTL